MKKILLFLSLILATNAFVFDFIDLNKAKKAYQQKDFKTSAKIYKKFKSQEAIFNYANSLYKEKKFNEAIKEYNKISSKKLLFKKLHNLGNSYAKTNQIDKAIKAYEDALKIKEDKDTRFNLELLKRKKRQQKQKNKQQNKKNNKKQSNKKNNSNKNKQNKKQSKKQNKKNTKQDKNKQNSKNKQDKQTKKNKQTKEKQKQKQNIKKEKKAKQSKKVPISDIEERKWKKLLGEKRIRTLMLPIQKGETNEQNNW